MILFELLSLFLRFFHLFSIGYILYDFSSNVVNKGSFTLSRTSKILGIVTAVSASPWAFDQFLLKKGWVPAFEGYYNRAAINFFKSGVTNDMITNYKTTKHLITYGWDSNSHFFHLIKPIELMQFHTLNFETTVKNTYISQLESSLKSLSDIHQAYIKQDFGIDDNLPLKVSLHKLSRDQLNQLNIRIHSEDFISTRARSRGVDLISDSSEDSND